MRWESVFSASRSGSGGPGLNAVDTGGAPGRRGANQSSGCRCRTREVSVSRWCQRRRHRLMDGIISYTDESAEGGEARGRPDTTSPPPPPPPQSHAILPAADIHHPVRAWRIVGDHWSEKIPPQWWPFNLVCHRQQRPWELWAPTLGRPATLHPSPACAPHDAPRETAAAPFSTCFLICSVNFAHLHFQSKVQFSSQSLPTADNLRFILHPLFHKYLYASRRKHTHALKRALQPQTRSAA